MKAVLDTNVGRDIALLEAAAEFLERYKAAHPGLEHDGEMITCNMAPCIQAHSSRAQEQPHTSIVCSHLPCHLKPQEASAALLNRSEVSLKNSVVTLQYIEQCRKRGC